MRRAAALALLASAALALADSSIVTLALPDVLADLDTSVYGVAAVIAVYTAVIAIALLPATRLLRRFSVSTVIATGSAAFGAGAIVCAAAPNIAVLLVGRVLEAAAGAAVLAAAGAVAAAGGRIGRWWTTLTVAAVAAGPTLGGALTQAFGWRSIFIAQAPVAAVAAVTARSVVLPARPPRLDRPRLGRARATAYVVLGLVSAASAALLFLLILLLVNGWAYSPLEGALVLAVLPVAAFGAVAVRGAASARAAAGAALVAAGIVPLAFLPGAHVWWVVGPAAVAGLGIGLTVIAAADLVEDDEGSTSLAVRHAGITVALLVLAPIVAHDLSASTRRAKLDGIALMLDARLPTATKIELAPTVFSAIRSTTPRAGLRRTADARRKDVARDDRPAFDRLAARADELVVRALGNAFRHAFLVGAAFAVAACGVALVAGGRRAAVVVVAAAALAALASVAYARERPERSVARRDPCAGKVAPGTDALGRLAMKALDQLACRVGASPEEVVLALADAGEAHRFERRYGINPRTLGFLLQALQG